MLAFAARMDPLRPSQPFSTDAPNLLRHPSAEDLDAAHQLVSSARGRNGIFGGQNPKMGDVSNDLGIQAGERDATVDAGQPQERRATARDVGETNLGQICRYVNVLPLFDISASLEGCLQTVSKQKSL
jgi:hypothetical protein